VLKRASLIADEIEGTPVVVLWEPATKTAAAYRPVAQRPRKFKGPRPDKTGVSPIDLGTLLPADSAPRPPRNVTLHRSGANIIDKETGSRWDITGRAVEGELKGWTLTRVDSVQVKWFAWAAEYPETSIYRAME